MNAAKVSLSAKEKQLVMNAEWILTKNNIITKAISLFASLQQQQQEAFEKQASHLPDKLIFSSSKISKGENYNGLPYVVLDYPRCFEKQDVFAVRTMLWWGHFFSCTLQLSGSYKKQLEQRIIASHRLWAANDFFLCIHESPWEHHFENDNYQPVKKFTAGQFKKIITEKNFIKLSKKIPLRQWNKAEAILLKTSKTVLAVFRP